MNSKDTNTVNRDNLIGSALAIDAMKYIIWEMQDGYFEKFNCEDEQDSFRILYNFKHNRARMAIISLLLNRIIDEFKENKITCYSE